MKNGVNGEKFKSKSIDDIEHCIRLVNGNFPKYDVLNNYNELYSEKTNYIALKLIYTSCY